MKRKNNRWAAVYGFLLTSFTVYILMDTFVMTHVYRSASPNESTILLQNGNAEKPEEGSSAGDAKTSSEQQSAAAAETTYHDSNLSISITEYRNYDTNIYVADVQVASANYLKTALTQGAYGKNVKEKTSVIAESNGAILAINGDYYGIRESGFVLRNGIIYRGAASGKQEDLVIMVMDHFPLLPRKKFLWMNCFRAAHSKFFPLARPLSWMAQFL